MIAQDALMAMLPEHLLLGGVVLLIVQAIVGTNARSALWVALGTVVASSAAAFWLANAQFAAAPFAGELSVTPAVLLAKGALLALAVPVLLMSRTDFSDGEFSILLLSSLYGLCLLPSSDSFLVMFLGLELLAMPVYALVLLAFRRPQSAEASFKYLVLSGAASATFLMGVSLLYGATGSMNVDTFGQAIAAGDLLSRSAVVLILMALFLKAAVVPFHAWAPDTYEGASIPVTAYMATLTKGAVLLAAVRLFSGVNASGPLADLLMVLPLVSIVWGNLAAMRQQSFRRMIAYSSIAHAGYLFYAFLGDAAGRPQAVLFYVVAYSVVNLLAFAAMPQNDDDQQRDSLDALKGLYHRQPFAAVLIAIAMLSLAGLPPFPGFAAKFLIFKNVMAAGYTTYAVLGLVGSYLGIYFYLRVIQLLFMTAGEAAPSEQRAGGMARTAGVLCLVGTLVLAVLPGWVLDRM
ncbi:MAG: NADH-quinone oxidoreductase subunit N [Gemmatimonadota bacterium]|nr:NADH-quinone oxidoreductase subunit N [Gemmatimonadota bacterium]MDQ8168811.1 NADH-quinone oxidoreductase subunit N [Gemmatimonadota bacterium]